MKAARYAIVLGVVFSTFGGLSLWQAGTVAEAAVVEPGFEVTLVADGFSLPTSMAFSNDGRIFVAEKGGTVRVVKNGVLLPTPVITLTDINSFGDRGLIGMATDPNFSQNGYLYLSYTYENSPGSNFGGEKTGRIVRVTVVGDVASESSKLVLVGTVGGTAALPSCENYVPGSDCIPSDSPSHTVGGLRFGPDGYLYATTGDGADFSAVDPRALRAQNIDSLGGKVLRINPDGTAPATNPFYNGNPNANRSKVYALGVRNMFRLNFHPVTGELFGGDVGWSTWEEVNHITPGANYGWPCYEGNFTSSYNCTPSSAVTLPTYVYGHDASGAGSITVGTFPSNAAYPAAYNNTMFIGDYAQNWIKLLVLDASNQVVEVKPFIPDTTWPVDLSTGPDGNVYYIDIAFSSLNRITHTTGNRRPVPSVAANPTSGLTPLSVGFSSAGSLDPDGDPLTYAWNFGDGALSNLPNPTHIYTANGTYTATLTLTDDKGSSASKSISIAVGNQAPTADITAPANGSLYTGGQTIQLNGMATDPEDGTLPASAYSWQILLHHNTHVHYMQQFIGVQNPTFIGDTHNDPTVYTEAILTVTDSGGLTGTQSINLYADNGIVGGNLIQNPSAEIEGAVPGAPASWFQGWFGTMNPIFSYPVAGYDGAKAMKLDVTSYTDGSAKWYFSPVSVTPGKTYLFSNFYTATVPTTQFAQLGMADGTNQYQLMASLPATVSPTKVEYSIVIPAGVQTISIFHELTAVGSLTTDNFSLTLVTPDTTPPTVSVTAPANTATVSGNVAITTTANDNIGVAGVTLLIDGAVVGTEDTTLPYDFTWNSTTVANGAHTISARARDAAGNQTTSAVVNVTVNNAQAAVNLVQNPSLETDVNADNIPDTWFKGGWGTNTFTFTYPTAGIDAAKAAKVEITAYTDGDRKWYFQDVPVTAGQTYTYSNQYKSTVSTEVLARYTLTGGALQYQFLGTTPASAGWSTATYNVTVPANAVSMTVFHILHAVGSLEVDNYSLTTLAAPDTTPPTVSVTAPANTATVSGNVAITTTANDNIGVAGVTLLIDGAVVGTEDTTLPYDFTWNSTTVANGAHTISARARDAAGNQTTSAVVNVTVNNAQAAVNLVQNADLETVNGNIPLGWIANTWGNHTAVHTYPVTGWNGGKAARTEITAYSPVNGTGDAKWYFQKVPVTPGREYRYTDHYRSSTISDIIGEYTLSDGTFHYFGLAKEIQPIATWQTVTGTFAPPVNATHVTFLHLISAVGFVEVDDVELIDIGAGIPSETNAPVVNFMNPLAGQTVSGTVTLTANSTDDTAVTYIFYAVDGIPITGQITTAPYAFDWNTTTVANGAHTLKATTHDPFGNNSTDTITVMVDQAFVDTITPAVSVTSPLNGSTISTIDTIQVHATDNLRVAGTTLLIDGVAVGAEDTVAPYAFDWDSNSVPNGTHTISARARDAAGNQTTSTLVTVTVNNPVATPNMILNGSLETDTNADSIPDHWIKGGWGTNNRVYTYPSVGPDGSRAAKIQITTYTDGDAKWYFENVPVVAGNIYTIEDLYRSDVQTNVTIRYTMTDGTIQYTGVANPLATSGVWASFSHTFTVPAGVSSLTVMHILNKAGSLEVDNVVLNPGTPAKFVKGMVSFTFDDGWLSQYTTALPILNAAGMKAGFYIITHETADPIYVNPSQILEFQATGHEVGGHTQTHPDLTMLTVAEQHTEIEGSRADLLALGVTTVDTFLYPHGGYNDGIKTITQNAGYIAARSVDRGFNTPTTDKFALKIQSVNRTTTIEEVQNWINQAAANNVWLVLMFHQIDDDPTHTFGTRATILQQIVDYVPTQNIDVVTMRQGVALMNP